MTSFARRALTAIAIVMSVLVQAPAQAQQAPGADAKGVRVAVKYTGKGLVDSNHRLWVWLFDTPEIGPGAIPVAETSVEKNGSVATFASVASPQVWIAVAYDEGGGFLGNAPPPPGSPIALYIAAAGSKPGTTPQAVTPGPKAVVSITFDETQRMQ